jgi:hypothetical protein
MLDAGCWILDTGCWILDARCGLLDRWLLAVGICLHIAGFGRLDPGSAARSVNFIMTAAYWLIGHRIIEFEQKGLERADYGEELLKRLSRDLTSRYGRGFAKSNLYQMRSFYMAYQDIFQTPSGISDDFDPMSNLQNFQTLSGTSELPNFQQDRENYECGMVIDD